MRDRLILLPGWGLGVSPLEPLAAALQGLDEHLQVQIEPLPDVESDDLQEWLDDNASFVAWSRWDHGMHEEDFIAFLNGCRLDPVATLKRFSLLCARGSSDPRSLARLLLAGAPKTSAQTLLMAGELFALLPDVEIGLIEQAGHAFLLEDPHGVAGAIQAFLHECGDD
eukprot:gene21398-25404_t